MTDTTFVDQTTVIEADWLNDINDHVYNNTPVSPATTVHPASAIANTPAGSIAATNVQDAINELDTEKATTGSVSTVQSNLTAHIDDTTAAHAASAIANTPAGSIAATDVQAAINELDTEKAALAGLSTQVFSVAAPTAAANAQRWDTPNMASLTVTQAGGALTFAGVAHPLTFRSATLTDGAVSTIIADPADLVLPSGGTLGFVTTVQGRIVVAEMNNGGTSEYAICNIAGGLQMDETNLISTTAIGTGSDSANVWYSTTARTNLPYKIVGAVDVVNTAGAWGNPVLVQAAGGLTNTALALHAEGSAPMFACRAWVNFNGTGTVAIRGSGNVSSITDNGTGDYTINFTSALADANYAPVFGAWGNGATASWSVWENSATTRTTSTLRIATTYNQGATTASADYTYVSVAIFR